MEFISYFIPLAGYFFNFMVVGLIACLPLLFVTGALEWMWSGGEQ